MHAVAHIFVVRLFLHFLQASVLATGFFVLSFYALRQMCRICIMFEKLRLGSMFYVNFVLFIV